MKYTPEAKKWLRELVKASLKVSDESLIKLGKMADEAQNLLEQKDHRLVVCYKGMA